MDLEHEQNHVLYKPYNWKIPLHVDDCTSSSVKIPSLYATILSKIKLIVWDEISMASMYVVGVVD